MIDPTMTQLDPALSAGVLARLDSLTHILGTTSHALWGLWLSTWWQPFIAVVAVVLLSGLAAWIAWRLYQYSHREGVWHFDQEMADVLTAFAGTAAAVLFVVFVCLLVSALPYAIDHRLYALHQLTELLRLAASKK